MGEGFFRVVFALFPGPGVWHFPIHSTTLRALVPLGLQESAHQHGHVGSWLHMCLASGTHARVQLGIGARSSEGSMHGELEGCRCELTCTAR